jgi:hypothetical protein
VNFLSIPERAGLCNRGPGRRRPEPEKQGLAAEILETAVSLAVWKDLTSTRKQTSAAGTHVPRKSVHGAASISERLEKVKGARPESAGASAGKSCREARAGLSLPPLDGGPDAL